MKLDYFEKELESGDRVVFHSGNDRWNGVKGTFISKSELNKLCRINVDDKYYEERNIEILDTREYAHLRCEKMEIIER